MRLNKKLQFLLLILTALVFSGQEIEHMAFHYCVESHSHYSNDSKTKHSSEIENATGSISKIFQKYICLGCNSITGKSVATTSEKTLFIKPVSITYSQLNESFSFNFHKKPASRGPPIA
jgi:hypothetical protein